MGQALREGLDEGCFQVFFCSPYLEESLSQGSPRGLRVKSCPSPRKRAWVRTAAVWVVVRLSGRIVT